MKFNRIISFALCALAACGSAWADGPFRAHRYDSFKATPTEPGQIVFAGNSITNMHSWFEAFGSHQEVIGRGNSGGFAYELLDNLESYIDAKPAKFFVMIGTNDISSGVSAELTARRIQAIVTRVRLESPETEVYIESILPRSSNAKPDYEQCNTLNKNYVAELNDPKVHFINLSEVCAGINNNPRVDATWSYDGLHPRPIGYSAWCHEIQEQVGYPTVYPETITSQDPCDAGNNSNGARVEQFPYFPFSQGDVAIYGDEQIHGGEWHELLRSNKIKDRAQCWGWGGISLVAAKKVITASLKDQAVKPSKIFLSYGVNGMNPDNYRAMVDEAKLQAPDAKIYIVSLTPSTDANTDAQNVAFNTSLQQIATEKGATYVDVYTPLKAEIGLNIMYTNYVSGRGYIVMANKFAEYLTEEGVNPVSLEEYEATYNSRVRRNVIGQALTRALVDVTYGTLPGQTNPEAKESIDAKFNELIALVGKQNLTDTEANAAAGELDALVYSAFNLPAISTETEEHWFTLRSARGNNYMSASGTSLVGTTAKPNRTVGNDVWKLVDRGNNTYDIVNHEGMYVSPVANYNTAMKVTAERPSVGFNISYSTNTAGTYVLYTSDCQINQTGSGAIFNWYASSDNRTTPDRADQGCAYYIEEFAGKFVDASEVPSTGWYILEGKQGLSSLGEANCVVNAEAEFRQNATNYYALKFENKPVDKPARAYVHVTINGTAWQFTSTNGHGIKTNCTSDRASLSTDNPAVAAAATDGEYVIGKWHTYNNNAGVFVGQASSSNDTYKITRVSDDELSAYDIWSVVIQASNAAEVGLDTRVAIDCPENQGITTVYNGGTFFLSKDTPLTDDMISVIPAEGVTQTVESPAIDIDPATKTIYVNYTDMLLGWYTMAAVGYSGSNNALKTATESVVNEQTNYLTACDTEYHQFLNSTQHNYYHVAFEAIDAERPARNFFRIAQPQATVMNLTSINGHHLLANGCASRAKANVTVAKGSEENTYNLPYCVWANNNIGAPGQLVGTFSGNTTTYEIQPVDMSVYDLYNVQIIGELPADAIVDDVKITLNSSDNLGLDAVYNGGVFFVTRDAAVTADNVVVPTHKNNDKPQITVQPGLITVDYDKVETAISEISTPAANNGVAYDLTGRRVAKPCNGIFIIDGRKVRL